MGNQQFCNLIGISNNQLQVILSGILGDGGVYKSGRKYKYQTNCKSKEYLLFKQNLLEDLSLNNIKKIEKNGYSQTFIYTMSSKTSEKFTEIKKLTLQEILDKIDLIGLALWFYDDGSLHKHRLFYNLNTHSFTLKENELIKKFLEKFNIFAKVTRETKKDGRIFYYLRISKYEGAYEITKILQNLPIQFYSYKLWNSETIQKWSKLQEKLKRTDKKYSNYQLGKIFCKI